MEQKPARRFPLAAVGVLLLMPSMVLVTYAMIGNFNQLALGEQPTADYSYVSLAMHPAIVACNVLGLILILVGIIRALRR